MAITIIGLAFALMATLYVLYRLVDRVLLSEEPPPALADETELREIDALAEKRAALLRELKDIELDYETAKIDEKDYKKLRRRFELDWLAVDEELEARTGVNARYLEQVDEELERRLLVREEERGRARRVDRKICGTCAGPSPPDAKHCQHCGDKLGATPRNRSKKKLVASALILLGSLVLGGSAWAQGPVAPGMAAPNDALHGGGDGEELKRVRVLERDKSGTATARIQVMRQVERAEDAPYAPVEGVTVYLQWRADRGSRLALSWEATSGPDGWAEFAKIDLLRDTRRFELRAVVQEGMIAHASPLLHAHGGAVTGTVQMLQVTGDPGHVIGGSLVSIMEIPGKMNEHPASYGFVQIRQIMELTTRSWAIYDTEQAMNAEDARGIRIELPIDAGSAQVQVMGGGGVAEIADSTIFYRGPIHPPGEGQPGTRLMVGFFLKASGSTLDYSQPMTLPFADVRATFVRDTDLPGIPIVDVAFEDHLFAETDDKADVGVMEGQNVLVVRGLSLQPGEDLEFTVTGLPYPDDPIPLYLTILAFLLAIAGVFLGRHELRKSRARAATLEAGGSELMEALDAQIESLYAGLAELEADYDAGELSPRHYERERSRLRTRLAMLLRQRAETSADG